MVPCVGKHTDDMVIKARTSILVFGLEDDRLPGVSYDADYNKLVLQSLLPRDCRREELVRPEDRLLGRNCHCSYANVWVG